MVTITRSTYPARATLSIACPAQSVSRGIRRAFASPATR
jgi:hypothetical protein